MALDFNNGVATGPFMAADETRKSGMTVPYGLKEASSADKAAWLEYANQLGYTSDEIRNAVELVYGPQSDASWRSYTAAANIDEPEYRAAELFGKYATNYNPGQAGYDFWNNRIKQVGFEAAKQEFLNPPQGESAPRFPYMFNDPDYQEEVVGGKRPSNLDSDVTTFGLTSGEETRSTAGITVPRGLQNMTRAQKAAWYKQQLDMGFDDAQIRQAYQDVIGAVYDGDWREISNEVLEQDVFPINPTLTTTPTAPTTPTATTTTTPTTPTTATTATTATTPTATVTPTTPTATVTPTTPTATVRPTTPTVTTPTVTTPTVTTPTVTAPTVTTGPNYGIVPGIAGAKYIGTRGFERPEYTPYAFAERGLGIPDALANILNQERGAPTKGTAQDLFNFYATGFAPDQAALDFWNNKIREKGFDAARSEFVNPSDVNAPRLDVMRQDPDYQTALSSAQQRADWYNSQIYKGFTDTQIREFYERNVGPQKENEWAALRNVAASRDPAGIANLADRARELVSRDLLSFTKNAGPGEGYVRPTTTAMGIGNLLPTTVIGRPPAPTTPTVQTPVVTAPTAPTVITAPTTVTVPTVPTAPTTGPVVTTPPRVTNPGTVIPNTPITEVVTPFTPVSTDTVIPLNTTSTTSLTNFQPADTGLTIGDLIAMQPGTGTTVGDLVNAQGTTGVGPTFVSNPIIPFQPGADTGDVAELAEGGIASLAREVQDKGRGNDTMLVHMTPNEVAGLQALAMQMGGSGTINPQTGLPEFGWLDKTFKKIIKPIAKVAQFVVPFIPGIGLPMAAALSGIASGFAGGKGGKTFDFKRALVSGITSYGLGSLARSAAAAGQASAVSGANAGQGLASNIDPSALEAMSASDVVANVAAQPITAAPGVTPAAVAPRGFINELPAGSGPMDYLKATGQNIQTSVMGAPDLFSKNVGVQQAAQAAGGVNPITGKTISPMNAATTAYMGTTLGMGMDEAEKLQAEQDAIAASIEDEDRRRREEAYAVIRANPWRFMEGGPVDDNLGYDFAEGGMPPRFLSGGGDGMSDSIPANIEGMQEARLADGEFVIPADVVSHLGNGSSKAGAQRLYSMMDRVREARTGTTKQGKEINPAQYMPV